MLINCEECIRQHTGACRDCVVTYLLDEDSGPLEVRREQVEALRALAECGLVPELRLLRRTAEA